MHVALVNVGTKFADKGYMTAWRKMLGIYAPREGRVHVTESRWPGWWSKLEVFDDDLIDRRPFLFFDLDTFVLDRVDDLIELASTTEDFWMLRDLTNPSRSNSGIMIVPKSLPHHLMWPTIRAIPSDVPERNPDGAFLARFPHKQLQDEIPGIVSYKKDCKEGPAGRIVCFHGTPKPHEVETGWAAETWKRLAQR